MEHQMGDTQLHPFPDSQRANMKQRRCGECQGCTTPDCAICKFCKDKKKFGGPGKLKKCCIKRNCTGIPSTTSIIPQSNEAHHSNTRQKDAVATTTSKAAINQTPLQYSELGDFPNKPIPRESHQPQQQPDITHLLLQQNRKIKPISGDGNCFFRSLSLLLYNTEHNHPQVRKDIVQFITDHAHLFHSLLITNDRSYTLQDHVQSMKKPTVWATQLEIQATVDLYGVPLYRYTPVLSGHGYQWYHYSKRTLAVPQLRYNHIELAHRNGNHFDCIIDAVTMKPCTVPPLLEGEQYFHSQSLQ